MNTYFAVVTYADGSTASRTITAYTIEMATRTARTFFGKTFATLVVMPA